MTTHLAHISDYGGKMIYWNDPEGHQWELLTVSYARRPR